MVQTEEHRQRAAEALLKQDVVPHMKPDQFKALFLKHHRKTINNRAYCDFIGMYEEGKAILS